MQIQRTQPLTTTTQQDTRTRSDSHSKPQKTVLLENQEKNFEKAYLYQKELNDILKKQIQHKEQEYKDLFTENKQLKGQMTEYKTRIKKLEEKVNEFKTKMEYYKLKAQELEKRKNAVMSLNIGSVRSQTSSQADSEYPYSLSGLSRSENINGNEHIDSSPSTEYTGTLYPVKHNHDFRLTPVKSWGTPSKTDEADEKEFASPVYENQSDSQRNREIMSPVRLLAKYDKSASKKGSNRKECIESEDEMKGKTENFSKFLNYKKERKNLAICECISSDLHYFHSDKLKLDLDSCNSVNAQGEADRLGTEAVQEAENVDQLARSVVALNCVPVVTYESNDFTPPKSIKNSIFNSAQKKILTADRRHTNIFFVSPEESGMKTHKELSPESYRADEKKKLSPVKLFEEYFVIGVDKNDVLVFEEENPNEKVGHLKAKILFTYPGKSDEMNNAPKNAVADFAFPFGVEAHKEKITSFTQLYEILFSKNDFGTNENCFAFPLLPGGLLDNQSFENDVLKEGNPNRLLYHVCIKTTDYLELGELNAQRNEGKKRLSRKYWKVEKVYCFMTFYPLIKFFMQLNTKILDAFKIERLQKFSEMNSDNRRFSIGGEEKNIFKELDAEWINQYLSTELSAYLSNVLALPSPKFDFPLEFKYKNFEKLTSQICERPQAFAMEAIWAAPLVFSYFPLKDLMYLLLTVMLEKKLVLLCENLAVLTSTLQILYSMIKPFKYPFPLIFNLPNLLLPLCDAPGAALIGINQGLNYLFEEDLISNYPECIFVVLNKGRINLFADPSVSTSIIEPSFDGVFERIFQIYRGFNPETKRTIESESTASPQKKPDSFQPRNANEKYIFDANETEYRNCLSILKLFYDALFNNIIKHIPSDPLYIVSDNKQLDYEALAQIIIKKNPKEEAFLSVFLNTQIFTYYLEQHYDPELFP